MSGMLGQALALAATGWAVFPCVERGPEPKWKSPYTVHGHLEASTDPGQIRAWWSRWPHAMIGAPVPAALLVLDLDPRTINDTLGVLLKYQDDITRVQGSEAARILSEVRAELALA